MIVSRGGTNAGRDIFANFRHILQHYQISGSWEHHLKKLKYVSQFHCHVMRKSLEGSVAVRKNEKKGKFSREFLLFAVAISCSVREQEKRIISS